METVWISKRGKVYHTDRDCLWMRNTRKSASLLGREVHPLQEVKPSEVGRRVECRVCRNAGEPPLRGPGTPKRGNRND